MQIRVLAFGVLRELLPSADFRLDIPSSCTVGEILNRLAREHESPAASLTDIWSAIAVAVNRDYVDRARPLADGDELALLPPVSGGTPDSPPSHLTDCLTAPPVHLTCNVIDTEAILAAMRHPEDGAVAIFDGIVRNNTRGRKTLFLVYESYDEMALSQMQQLAAEARRRFPIHQAALVHRLGRIEIGESSVFIAVCSAHRAAAFDACRWLIDTLKKTVPIWKQEHFEDGAVWAPGEPFPPQIAP